MKRYTGQKALYEAINRSRGKVKRPNILERLKPALPRPESPIRDEPPPRVEPVPPPAEVVPPPVVEKPEPVVERPIMPPPKPRPIERIGRPAPGPTPTWLRPKPVQLNEGRLDISVPYYVGIIAVLAVVLAVLVAFKLGQVGQEAPSVASGQPSGPVDRPTPTPVRSTPRNAATTAAARPQPTPPGNVATSPPPQDGQPSATPQESQPALPVGDHWIVLARHNRTEDLDAVVKYFGEHGVELGIMALTEENRKAFAQAGFNAGILPNGAGFLLVTKKLYDSPEKQGTDGYAMRLKIAELGKGYKAPPGLGSFAPHYFGDAYGMKIR